jgi:hypothetical protein
MAIEGKNRRKLGKTQWKDYYAFEAYQVRIGIRSNNSEMLEELRRRLPFLLPTGFEELDYGAADHIFSIVWSDGRRKKSYFYKNDEEIGQLSFGQRKLDALESQIRLTVAEFAADFVFLHAGAVRYKGRAIIIPARSFSGKTTLVAEFARHGLEYYSDEYAVIDRHGLLHPFPKQLSMRGIIDNYQQLDMDVEEFGGVKGEEPVEVGLVLISKYKKRARFRPQIVSSGEGIIETIANSVSIRQNPQFVLGVLGKVMNQAMVIRTNRSEARSFVRRFLPYLQEVGF